MTTRKQRPHGALRAAGAPDSSETATTGPFSFLHPTRAHYPHPQIDQHGVSAAWSSRNNRKGRHGLALTPSADASSELDTPRRTSHPAEIAKGIWRMFVVYPVWDVSYLVAIIFTLGSVVWVFNAFFVFLPDLKPSTTFPTEELYGGGITAFIGATIFEVGSVLLMLEAINEKKEACFGWAVKKAIDDWEEDHENSGAGGRGSSEKGNVAIKPDTCSHHHANKKNLVGKGGLANKTSPASLGAKEKSAASPQPADNTGKSWVWWPSLDSLRNHYIYELGFLACFSQLIGASIFWIAGFTALPGIYNHMSQGLIDGIYWVPQVIGGSGFIISGTLFMLETQSAWYKPALGVLGWHIGAWNLIGGIGFTLSPCFGFDTSSWAQYQAACSTFWGSWAFLIGSAIQWYESLDKYPVDIRRS